MLYSKFSGEMYQRLPSTASVIISGVACDSREPSSWVVDKSISYLLIFLLCAETASKFVPDVQPAML